jgi:hypothetical protein
MNIWTDDFRKFGKTVNIIDQKVTFDKNGCAEVDDKFGKDVLKIYSGIFFKEEPKVEEPSVAVINKIDDSEDKAAIENLKSEIVKYQDTLTRKRIELDTMSKEYEGFKILFDEQSKELNELKNRNVEVSEVSNSNIEEIQMKYSLALKGLSGCKFTCKKMNLPEAEYKEDKDLEKLIEYIISKAK